MLPLAPRLLAIMSAVTMLSAACSPAISIGTPVAAGLYLTGDPAVATVGLTLRMTGGGNEVVATLAFEPGERIVGLASAMPGDYTLADEDGTCSLAVALLEGRETDVVIQATGSGPCRLAVAGEHPSGEGPHPWFGALVATLAGPPVAAATLEVRSLDAPPNPVPPPVAADPDDSSRFYIDSLPPGRYEAQVRSMGTVIGTQAFEIGTGPRAEVSVEIQPQPGS
jgi:hypothetical protein